MKLTPILAGAGLTAAIACAGCGSGSTRTISVSSSPSASSASTAAASTKPPAPATASKPTTSTATHASTPTAAPATPSGGAAAPAGGSSHEPAFVGQGAGGPGLSAAIGLMRSRGYSVLDPSQYRPDQTLKVLVGAREGSASHVQQAFFFVGGRYLGTDTSAPSGQIHLVGQNDTEVTLAYSLYRARDGACCPSGGQAQVRYQLDNGRLVALDPIPAVAATSAGAGRQ